MKYRRTPVGLPDDECVAVAVADPVTVLLCEPDAVYVGDADTEPVCITHTHIPIASQTQRNEE